MWIFGFHDSQWYPKAQTFIVKGNCHLANEVFKSHNIPCKQWVEDTQTMHMHLQPYIGVSRKHINILIFWMSLQLPILVLKEDLTCFLAPTLLCSHKSRSLELPGFP